MKIDVEFEPSGSLAAIGADVRALEAEQVDGILVSETNHEPFMAATLLAEHTTTSIIGTRIAVAFARSPAIVASAAHDLQLYSDGRFVLGLGTQVRAHIEKRFSMPWSAPVARMREYIHALHAFWATWNDGADLNFTGEFYAHTLMTPLFSPPPSPNGPPPVHIAAVGPRMTQLVGELGDGILIHALHTADYLRKVVSPAVAHGASLVGRSIRDVEFCAAVFVVTADDEAGLRVAADATRKRIAFYASTPTYRGVLDLHGWGDLHDRLNAMSRRGEWDAMGELVDDEVLETFAIVAPPDEVGDRIKSRYQDVLQRVTFRMPYDAPPGTLGRLIDGLRRDS